MSKAFYKILIAHCHQLQAVSCDEAYLDATNLVQPLADLKLLSGNSSTPSGRAERPTAEHFVEQIRSQILEQLGIEASAGVAHNALLARMCTRVAKPNGQYVLLPSEALEFIKQRKVEDLPGVGWSHAQKLAEIGATTCSKLQDVPREQLQVLLQSNGNGESRRHDSQHSSLNWF